MGDTSRVEGRSAPDREGGLLGTLAGAAAGCLGGVHAAVSLPEELTGVIRIFGEGGKAERDSDTKGAPLACRQDLVLNGVLHATGYLGGTRAVGAGQDDGELVAAQAGHDIGSAGITHPSP